MKDSFSEKRMQSTRPRLDPARTAVLVVDMLNDFFKPDGAMVLEGGDVLYEPIDRLLVHARSAGMPVFWLNQTLYPEDKLFEKRVVHCLEGTWGAEIVDDLSFGEDDVIIAKRRYSGFFQTDLDLHLRERDIRHLVVTGVVTNICVRSTVNDAFFLGYDVYVPRDCVMATSEEHQETHLYDIDTHYGTVLELDALLAETGDGVRR
jgi:ureidoacrylate peracid hydrolase